MIQVGSSTPTLSLEEIEGRLPLIARIADDLVRTWAEVLRTRTELERCSQPECSEERDRIDEYVDDLDRMVRRVQGYISEVEQLGGTFQEYKRGVVNFPIEHEERAVLACWVVGEEGVVGWHEAHETLAQRKPF